MAETQKVELGKESKRDILAALKGIRNQIQVSTRRENTPADVAAEHIAGGGGLVGAVGAAASFKTSRAISGFKNRFDPLAIINRLTGGSKLATVLAGKVMGRSEKSIRSRAGLQPVMEESPTQVSEQAPEGSPTQDTDATEKKEVVLLEAMVKSLAWIASHISHIALKLDAIKPQQEIELFKQLAEDSKASLENQEQLKDQAAEDRASFKKSPTPVTKKEQVEKKEGGGIFSTILKALFAAMVALAPAILALLPEILAFGAGVALLGTAIYKFKDEIATAFKFWTGDDKMKQLSTGVDMLKEDAGDLLRSGKESIVRGVKNIGADYLGIGQHEEAPRTTPTTYGETHPQAALDKTAGPGFQGPLQKKDKVSEAVQGAIPKVMETTPLIEGKATQEHTSKVAKAAYAQAYSEPGRPVTIESDPMKATRVPQITALSTQAVAEYAKATAVPGPRMGPAMLEQLQTPRIVPMATEVPAPAPQTGQLLSQANEAQRNFAVAPMTSGSSAGATVINNVKNNNVQSTTIHQDMAPSRSEESSYLRSLDKRFAPA